MSKCINLRSIFVVLLAVFLSSPTYAAGPHDPHDRYQQPADRQPQRPNRHAPTVETNRDLTTELWQGKILTASFRAGICYKRDGKAKGVMILRHANGNEDVYHVYGMVKKGRFDFKHSSGHHFYGELPSANNIVGKANLKNSISLTLKGTRTKNVPLAAEDCAPLR